MTFAQGATALTHHFYREVTGDEREAFLNRVGEGATSYGMRGSTASGTAGVDTLVEHLFSSFYMKDKTLASHRASFRNWLQSVR